VLVSVYSGTSLSRISRDQKKNSSYGNFELQKIHKKYKKKVYLLISKFGKKNLNFMRPLLIVYKNFR
jgi:hypothetical protein